MQLGDQRASGNVEDRRGIGMVGGGLGVGGIVIALIAYFLGFDPGGAINVAEQVVPQRETREVPKGAPADEMGQFVAKILGSTEEVWGKIFQQSASQYRPGRWSSMTGKCARPAVWGNRPWAPSTVKATRSSTSTSRSSATCRRASAPRAISRRPT
jgi:predicted metalloprotease